LRSLAAKPLFASLVFGAYKKSRGKWESIPKVFVVLNLNSEYKTIARFLRIKFHLRFLFSANRIIFGKGAEAGLQQRSKPSVAAVDQFRIESTLEDSCS